MRVYEGSLRVEPGSALTLIGGLYHLGLLSFPVDVVLEFVILNARKRKRLWCFSEEV
jgi:hypothetical protein